MAKKINFDREIKKLENISNKINIIMKNNLIIALFLIVDGITFLLNPNGSLERMSRSIIILVLLASFSTLVANLSLKTKDIKTIIISIIIIIMGIIIYIYPNLVSAYIQLALSIFIIYIGLKNILSALNLNKISKYTQIIKERYNRIKKRKNKKKRKQESKFKDVNKSFNEGMEKQKERLVNPLTNIVDKTGKFSVIYIIANCASIILGIILIIFPDVSMAIWGIIFLYTGIPDLVAAMRAINISSKIKNKDFKGIIYGENKKDLE